MIAEKASLVFSPDDFIPLRVSEASEQASIRGFDFYFLSLSSYWGACVNRSHTHSRFLSLMAVGLLLNSTLVSKHWFLNIRKIVLYNICLFFYN